MSELDLLPSTYGQGRLIRMVRKDSSKTDINQPDRTQVQHSGPLMSIKGQQFVIGDTALPAGQLPDGLTPESLLAIAVHFTRHRASTPAMRAVSEKLQAALSELVADRRAADDAATGTGVRSN